MPDFNLDLQDACDLGWQWEQMREMGRQAVSLGWLS